MMRWLFLACGLWLGDGEAVVAGAAAFCLTVSVLMLMAAAVIAPPVAEPYRGLAPAGRLRPRRQS